MPNNPLDDLQVALSMAKSRFYGKSGDLSNQYPEALNTYINFIGNSSFAAQANENIDAPTENVQFDVNQWIEGRSQERLSKSIPDVSMPSEEKITTQMPTEIKQSPAVEVKKKSDQKPAQKASKAPTQTKKPEEKPQQKTASPKEETDKKIQKPPVTLSQKKEMNMANRTEQVDKKEQKVPVTLSQKKAALMANQKEEPSKNQTAMSSQKKETEKGPQNYPISLSQRQAIIKANNKENYPISLSQRQAIIKANNRDSSEESVIDIYRKMNRKPEVKWTRAFPVSTKTKYSYVLWFRPLLRI